MAQPLFARSPESRTSNENADGGIEEEDALLTGQRTGKTQSTKLNARSKWRERGLFAWAVIATTTVIVLAVMYQHSRSETGGEIPSGKRNVIFMVSDGMGPTSLSLTRTWRQYTEQLPYDQTLFLDDYLIGQSRTRSTSSLVTDSAAGATAFSCGNKTYNGAIAVLPNFEPCGSVMEAAKRKGYTTGLVVTTRITDATPAVFVSHVRKREMEDAIARQMIGETHPWAEWHDDLDVIQTAKEEGWTYVDSKSDFKNLDAAVKLPVMALFAPTDFPYEIDRRFQDDVYPSLEEMTKTALRTLSQATKDSDQGFFIMIEGSRIDHAGHANDPGAQVHEVLAYDRAMSAVIDFINEDKSSETPTLMVATSDHETGGLAVARQLYSTYPQYLWYPGVLANVSQSASHTAREFRAHLDSYAKHGDGKGSRPTNEDTKTYLTELSKTALGIDDCEVNELDALIDQPLLATYIFADMVSRRAQTGWTTHGHSGADVNIYASDPQSAKDLIGNHENTDVGAFLRSYLELEDEVEVVTSELRKHMKITGESWLGGIPMDGERLDGQDHLDHYHGDHKVKRCCEL